MMCLRKYWMLSFKNVQKSLNKRTQVSLNNMTRTSEVVTNKGNSSDNNIKVI